MVESAPVLTKIPLTLEFIILLRVILLSKPFTLTLYWLLYKVKLLIILLLELVLNTTATPFTKPLILESLIILPIELIPLSPLVKIIPFILP
ncbi:hypothetical protein MBCUR_17340 [Methanobrevibacter curvatus]|uniref:Uncharacterized protein n=1 Tax=Methanobrevibacter curvatus TaxID=49547 RepID=A0A166C1J9_9EURY|nr:hypothetical protein MBCUR_17340 [Methanobrevibacter curvatus]